MTAKYTLVTEHPVAVASRDHTHPLGTRQDNSRNRRFNRKLYELMYSFRLEPRVLDLGCAGGGFVADCLLDGHEAVGLEGSDYSLLHRRAEWPNVPDNLFTCDITKPFRLYRNGLPARFGAATSWMVMEHLPEESLAQVCENILWHLCDGGLAVMGIDNDPGEFHHLTNKDRAWWLDTFARHGLRPQEDLPAWFGSDWVRGPAQGTPDAFHVVLRRER
jgi:SAM-dependent methyltransferase